MKNIKVIKICLTAFMVFALTGCQLAREEGVVKNRDRLVGVFITEEYPSLFDTEGYLNDNINKLSRGGNITIDGNDSEYQGRLYAKLVTQTRTNEKTGNTVDVEKYVFDDVEGMFYATILLPRDGTKIRSSHSDEGISDCHMGFHGSDDEDKTTMEGTIYLSLSHADKVHHINPVYQSDDGSVYAVSGNGISGSGYKSEGASLSANLKESTSTTLNGKSKLVSASIKISITMMFPPERIVVIQMGEENELLSRKEYIPDEVPNAFEPEDGAEYIIVETHKNNLEGDTVVSRSLYDKSDKNMETFYCRYDGICVKKHTSINWRDAGTGTLSPKID